MIVYLSSLVSMLCVLAISTIYFMDLMITWLFSMLGSIFVIIGWTESSTDTAQNSEIYVQRIRNVGCQAYRVI